MCIRDRYSKWMVYQSPEEMDKSIKNTIIRKMRNGWTITMNEAITSNRLFSVMLPLNYYDYEDRIKYPIFSQPKLDGIRCFINQYGMFSRNHKRIESCPHIFEQIKPIFENHPKIVLDGELYNHELNSNFSTIVSLLTQTHPTPVSYTHLTLPTNREV